jgi:hypothetical protein
MKLTGQEIRRFYEIQYSDNYRAGKCQPLQLILSQFNPAQVLRPVRYLSKYILILLFSLRPGLHFVPRFIDQNVLWIFPPPSWVLHAPPV